MWTQVQSNKTIATTRVVFVERGLLYLALLGCKEQVALAWEFACVDDGLNIFAWLQRQQVDNRNALCRALALGNVDCAQTIHAASV